MFSNFRAQSDGYVGKVTLVMVPPRIVTFWASSRLKVFFFFFLGKQHTLLKVKNYSQPRTYNKKNSKGQQQVWGPKVIYENTRFSDESNKMSEIRGSESP